MGLKSKNFIKKNKFLKKYFKAVNYYKKRCCLVFAGNCSRSVVTECGCLDLQAQIVVTTWLRGVRSVVAWFREGAACAANPGEILQNFMEFLKSQAREQVATRGWSCRIEKLMKFCKNLQNPLNPLKS